MRPTLSKRRRESGKIFTGGSLAITLAVIVAATNPASAGSQGCTLAGGDLRWIHRALSAWALARDRKLHLSHFYNPTIVLFESHCAWRLDPVRKPVPGTRPGNDVLEAAGMRYAIADMKLHGSVPLPDGSSAPVQKVSFTAPLRDKAFMVMSGPELWHGNVEQSLGVFVHEMTHTQQRATLGARLNQLVRDGVIQSSDNDDVVQSRYARDPQFAASVDKETALLFAAAAAPTDHDAVAIARRAVASIKKRRGRVYQGKAGRLEEVEDVFLSMEGTAQWAGYQYLRDPEGGNLSSEKALALISGKKSSWMLQEGLGLFLVLDRLHPSWPREVLGSKLTYGVPLLERTLSDYK